MLHIIVPIKQVPDIERVKFDVETGRIDRSSAPGEINPFDLHAIEAAVKIKEKHGGTVTAISMGPRQAESALRDALARGADRAILLSDRRFAGADTLATSYALACAIKKLGSFDLVICGEKTVDGDTGQVGPEIAEHLGIPHAAYVSSIERLENGEIEVVADYGEAYYRLSLKLPALLTVTKDINTPRLPTLKDKLRARKADVEVWTVDDLAVAGCDSQRFGFAGSPTMVAKVIVPEERGRNCVMISEDEAAEKLAHIILEKIGEKR